MKVAIVGCGNMGLAFARSFIQYDLISKNNLLLIEKNSHRCEHLRNLKEGVVVSTIDDQIKLYDLVIISVKPQDFKELVPDLRQVLGIEQVVLSIMAGITISHIQEALDHKLVIRAMPNTPAMIGMGITGFTAAAGISFQKLLKVENLINATGRSVYFENEHELNAVTAISGSGPAYFYYIVKSMVDAAIKMGFDEGTASLFVKQTMLGAYHLINNAELSLDELIKAVASKGGTTEAALKVFQNNQLDSTIQEALFAARDRSEALSKA
ncbi:MAG: pyrroline-5-carboxylate reductase [Saprospiraceae bacterium]